MLFSPALMIYFASPSMSGPASEGTPRIDPIFILYLTSAIPIRRLEIKDLMTGEVKCCTAACLEIINTTNVCRRA